LKIERHPAVIAEDLSGIYAHIARDNPAAAENVLEAVEEAFARIAALPESGVLYPTNNPKMRGVRMLPLSGFTNYLVFYRIEDHVVRVLYVVHGARHLPHLFQRDFRE